MPVRRRFLTFYGTDNSFNAPPRADLWLLYIFNLFPSHRAASDANCWTMCSLFVAIISTLFFEEFASALEFPVIQFSCEFL